MTVTARPSALARWGEIERLLTDRRPALFLDYDGTLAPLAPRPDLATLPEATREVLRRLADRFPVAVLSGRAREDVAALVDLDALTYAGGHGFDIAGPSIRHELGEGIPEVIERAAVSLRRRLGDRPGVLVEPKRFAVAVHFRLARKADLPYVEEAVDAVLADHPELRKTWGKKVFELRPALDWIDWDKGRVLLWLLEEMGLEESSTLPVYLGDDLTDEDAFRALEATGLGILVATEPRPTAARYSLGDPVEVREFLERVAGLS